MGDGITDFATAQKGVIGLRLCTKLNEMLIKLSADSNQPGLRTQLVQIALTLAIMNGLTKRDAEVIAYNFEYTFYQFSDVLAAL